MKKVDQIHPILGERERRAMDAYLRSGGWLTEHNETKIFEDMLATFLGVKHCILTTSGTAALALATMAMFSFTDRPRAVAVPDMTMIASANAVILADGWVELVDVDSRTICMNITELDKYEADHLAAVIYVSFNGRCGDMSDLLKLCRRKGWFLIEDACQSFGSKHCGKYLGTFGDVGCFSLSPHKIITTGQGGFCVTNNRDVATRIRELKNFGRKSGGVDWHPALGYNFKFTDLQAVIGQAQMEDIRFRLQKKRNIYNYYIDRKTGLMDALTDDRVPWMVDMYSAKRDKLYLYLSEHGIGCRKFYPPIHTQYPYNKTSKKHFKNSYNTSKFGLWLPSSIDLTAKEVDYICDLIEKTA